MSKLTRVPQTKVLGKQLDEHFREQLVHLLNCSGVDNAMDTPDYRLADALCMYLHSINPNDPITHLTDDLDVNDKITWARLELKMGGVYASTTKAMIANRKTRQETGVATDDSIWNAGYLSGQQNIIREVMEILKPHICPGLGDYFEARGDGPVPAGKPPEPVELTSEMLEELE